MSSPDFHYAEDDLDSNLVHWVEDGLERLENYLRLAAEYIEYCRERGIEP